MRSAAVAGSAAAAADAADFRLTGDGQANRSINLALSVRGIKALAGAGGSVVEEVLAAALPMGARMVHAEDGGAPIRLPYGDFGETIRSVGRSGLNEILLRAAEALHPAVKIYFDKELVSMDATAGVLKFRDRQGGRAIRAEADFILGCDGTYSAVRRELLRYER